MNILVDNDKPDLFFPRLIDGGPVDEAENISKTANNIKKLHYHAEQLLVDWLDNPPTERRQMQALNLFVEAVQLLNASCINLGVIEISDAE